jgi:biopolymer transport protein ExbB
MMFGDPWWPQIDVQGGWAFISEGGVLMYPLLLCSVLVVAITLERWLRLRLARTDADALYGIVEHMVTRQALGRAQAHLQLHTGALAAVLRALLAAQSHDQTDLEDVVVIQARRELRRLNTRLPTLNLIAGLALLTGLLGTVVGMVQAFQQVATAQGVVNPNLLASDIWEALLPSVMGLVVAIPAVIFHHALAQRAQRYAFEMDYYSTAVIGLLRRSEFINAYSQRCTSPSPRRAMNGQAVRPRVFFNVE